MSRSNDPQFDKRIKRSWLLALVAVLACVAPGGVPGASIAADATPTRIELWRTGDDVLTMRFAAALEDAFRKSGAFLLALGGEAKTPNTLVVHIDENLKWKATDGATTAFYRISFEGPTGQALGSSKGSCLDSDLDACTVQAIRDTKRAAARLH